MKYSQMLIPTAKEVPADAEIPSHQLMLRAGLMRKLASGTYTYLPLGWRCLQKVMTIIREEMNRSGAQEILMPAVQPIELWKKTGRDVDYGETMAKFTDRHGRVNVLAPTAEEVVTDLAANEINSYKQLPINIYQISFKFRDEFRPRLGVLRSREFIMKDAYSFDADEAGQEAALVGRLTSVLARQNVVLQDDGQKIQCDRLDYTIHKSSHHFGWDNSNAPILTIAPTANSSAP